MNSSQRNSLDYSGAQLEELSDVSLLEVMQEKTDEETSSKYVLIKHDFYSSDSEHGRKLLATFLSSLYESSYSHVIVYLIDQGVKLLDESNSLHDSMLCLLEKSEMTIAAVESMSFYDVTVSGNSKIVEQSARSIAEDISYLPNLLVLE